MPPPPLTLARVLAPLVPEPTRSRGVRYFRAGAVGRIDASEALVRAIVHGSRQYRVALAREGDGYTGSCECPYFTDRMDICKHIWSLVLAADDRGLLPPRTPDAYLDPADTADADGADEDAGPASPWSRSPAPVPVPHKPAWQQFLDGVSRDLSQVDTAPGPRYADGQLLYVIDRPATLARNGIALSVQFQQRKKNGEWGKPQPAALTPLDVEQLPDADDRDVLALLLGAADGAMGPYASVLARSSFNLSGPLVDRVLPLAARSGRLYLRSEAGLTPLEWDEGPPWRFALDVTHADGDLIRVDGSLARAAERLPAAAPDLVVAAGYLVKDGRLARLDAGGAFTWLAQLRRSGAAQIPREAAPALVEALARSSVDPSRLPADLRYDVVDAMPGPRVKVTRGSHQAAYGQHDLEAAVEFDYDGTIVPALPGAASYDAARRRMVRRNRAAEQSALRRLQQLGFRRDWRYAGSSGLSRVAVEQFPRAVRTLVAEGWHVEAEGRAFRAAHAMRVEVKSGIDWFELHGRVEFGDGRSAPVAELLAALRRGDATVILDDGTRGMVPEDWLRRYARIASFGEAEGDHVRYRTSQAALLDALLETQRAVTVDEAFGRARAALHAFTGIRPEDPPASFTGRLREYQREALGWFAFLREFGFGGCLADDMGLGKTVMVLALLESRRRAGGDGAPRPSLAVVPRSLVFNWMDEARRFAPEMRVLDYTGASRSAARLEDSDLVLTTYGTLRRDAARLNGQEFDYVILDEAQAIKNALTASAKAVRLLRGRHRLALSGTPIENHVGELWSLFEFLNPGLLGSSSAFSRATALQGRMEREDLALVTRAVRPLILRRTKQQVAPELPERSEQTIHCELDTTQRRFYDELRAHYRATLLDRVAREGLGRSKLQVLEALLRLRQAACHAGLVDERRKDEPSAKFDVLLPQLAEVIEEGHKALVFSQFTTLLGLLRARLDEERIVYEYLDGRTRDRAERVERFRTDGSCRVFLISLKAGGLGLNLTAADYVFLLDPWWNPAVEAQAIDRAHRIGQARQVFAYRLLARDTVEEKVAELQQTKRELADAILTADAGMLRNLKAEDLEWLLD